MCRIIYLQKEIINGTFRIQIVECGKSTEKKVLKSDSKHEEFREFFFCFAITKDFCGFILSYLTIFVRFSHIFV